MAYEVDFNIQMVPNRRTKKSYQSQIDSFRQQKHKLKHLYVKNL